MARLGWLCWSFIVAGISTQTFAHSSSEQPTQNVSPKLVSMFEFLVHQCKTQIGDLKLTRIAGGYYYFHTEAFNMLNWFQAKDWCAERGMILANLETAEEAKAVTDKLRQIIGEETFFGPSGFGFPSYWIGANDLGTEGTFRWLSGRLVDTANWFNNQPDNFIDEDCVSIARFFGILGWNDSPCRLVVSKYICEVTNPCNDILNMLNSFTGDQHSHSDSSNSQDSFQHGRRL